MLGRLKHPGWICTDRQTGVRARRALGAEGLVPLAELLEDDPVGESLPADTDPFQDTIAAQLLQH